ncbi:MAG: hypothetical protein J7L73_05685 [Anaerolineales bacterium]|nr:hypothetical protein [Anaerolineales bacterium]HEY62675.1 hypothetical protein [Anaerolineae bacterium]
MNFGRGLITEILTLGTGLRTVKIKCPANVIPPAGRFAVANDPLDLSASLPSVLFKIADTDEGFIPVPPVPDYWKPGTYLDLVRPSGKGFKVPKTTQRLMVISAVDHLYRLIGLINDALSEKKDVAVFTDGRVSGLSTAVEVSPFSAIPENLQWADFLAMAVDRTAISSISSLLGVKERASFSCPGQVLVITEMPCAGLGECWGCAISTRNGGQKLVCKHGPVFDLFELDW